VGIRSGIVSEGGAGRQEFVTMGGGVAEGDAGSQLHYDRHRGCPDRAGMPLRESGVMPEGLFLMCTDFAKSGFAVQSMKNTNRLWK